jgi:mono/diheme cytochrome c family protein
VKRVVLTLAAVLAWALAPVAAGRTVWDGVYATSQAERGAGLYAGQCSRCHGDFLDGDGAAERAVALVGPTFEENWDAASLSDLFDTIGRTMPRGAPGTLTRPQVLDVMAFLLQSNGYPVGTAELQDTAELASIDVVGRNGPTPLRVGSGVRSVGCLVKESGDGWTLVRASVPLRTRNPSASRERDLERARATPLGTGTITLAGAVDGRDRSLGMKVEVKGALAAVDAPRYRITVMSLQAIGPACQP